MNEYEQQAIDFLNSTNTEFKCEFVDHSYHFNNDQHTRDIYITSHLHVVVVVIHLSLYNL